MSAIWDCDTLYGSLPRREADISVARLLEILGAHSVDRALSCSARGIFHDFGQGNDETVRLSQEHEPLIPVGTLAPSKMIDFRDEVKKCMDQGVRVFRFFPDHQHWPFSFLPFRRALEQLADQDVIIMLPFQGTGSLTDLVDATRDLGRPVIVTDVGYTALAELVVAMELHPMFYASSRLLSGPDCFPILRQAVGLERVLFGSGAPFHYFESASRLVTDSSLSAAEKQAVLGGNLQALLASAGDAS